MIGAGPAGLSAGYFLARAGHPVTLFEREKNAGGVVKNIIPQFRIPAELIQHDIDFVADHGVRFEYGCDQTLTVEQLQEQGFKYVCVGIGADKNSGIRLAGDNHNLYKSFDFLRRFNQGDALPLGREVAVIGAGNTAMDCARAALRVPGVRNVTVIYRRSLKEMPAYREEYLEAVEDNVQFRFLTNPERFDANGTLTVRVMTLGEPDDKGRRQPVPTNEQVTLHIDSLITAIGEQPDCGILAAMGVPLGADGWPQVDRNTGETARENVFLIGDVQSGPSSIVAAIGDARRATEAILQRERRASGNGETYRSQVKTTDIYARKGAIHIEPVDKQQREAFVVREAERCLECNYVCSKCVDVCPNRANISIPVPGFHDRSQTLHIDAYCNECGNCAQFCPWQGKPYKDKVTIFSLPQDFENSTNPGFLLQGNRLRVRQQNTVYQLMLDDHGGINSAPPELEDMCRIINQVITHHHYLLGTVEE